MADVTIDSAVLSGGTLTITGSNFTQTTTAVFIDGSQAAQDYVSATELTVGNVASDASSVTVSKGGVDATAAITSDAATPAAPAAAAEADLPAGGSQGNTGPVAITQDDLKLAQDGADMSGPPGVEAEKSVPVDIPANKPYPSGNPPAPDGASNA